ELRPELEARPLGDFSVLYDSEIRVEKARAAQNVPAGVAKRPHGIRNENRPVEVFLDQLSVRAAGIQLGLAEVCSDKVGAIDTHAAEGGTSPAEHRQGEAAATVGDRSQLR